jgi:nucleotide-binding universal stress UspA family protein
MKADKILFATDFSPASEAALVYASSLARDSGAKLLIVHVEEPPLAYGAGEMYVDPLPVGRPGLEETLQRVRPTLPEVRYEHHLLIGTPAQELVELAEKEKVDLIVMGTHGRTGFSRLVMGSVAESVVRRAGCPVFTLKQPAPLAASS